MWVQGRVLGLTCSVLMAHHPEPFLLCGDRPEPSVVISKSELQSKQPYSTGGSRGSEVVLIASGQSACLAAHLPSQSFLGRGDTQGWNPGPPAPAGDA